MVGNKKILFGTTHRMLEILSLERNISEHDITQHTLIATEKCFFSTYHKLGWDME